MDVVWESWCEGCFTGIGCKVLLHVNQVYVAISFSSLHVHHWMGTLNPFVGQGWFVQMALSIQWCAESNMISIYMIATECKGQAPAKTKCASGWSKSWNRLRKVSKKGMYWQALILSCHRWRCWRAPVVFWDEWNQEEVSPISLPGHVVHSRIQCRHVCWAWWIAVIFRSTNFLC